MDALTAYGTQTLGTAWPVVWALARIVAIVVPILLMVAYLTFWERKLIGWMHIRIGPNRVGPWGLLQPIADAVKLIFKEVITPTQADGWLYFLAPVIIIMPALAAWAVIPFAPGVVLADINAGLLFVMAITSVGVYGVIIAGWASNSKYSFLGAMRASAQMVSYELAMGFVLVTVLMVSGTLNLTQIVLFAVVIASSGIVSAERKSGTAVLVLTKPVSRTAFVLAKALSSVALLAAAVVGGGVLCWGGTLLLFGSAPAGPLVAGTLVYLAYASMLVTVMVLLSALIDGQAGAAGAGVGFFALTSILGLWPSAVYFSPAGLIPAKRVGKRSEESHS